jgi:hypothetical protein
VKFFIYLVLRFARYALAFIVVISALAGCGWLIGAGVRNPIVASAVIPAVVLVWFIIESWHEFKRRQK